MKLIRSRDNPQFQTLLKLSRSAKERHNSKMMLLDGDHLIETAHDAGVAFSLLAIQESALLHARRHQLFESIPAASRLVLADALLGMISPVSTASGLVAMAPIPHVIDFPRVPLDCLLLDAIQDPGNLGTILRTAAAAGVREVALSTGSVSPWSPKVLRAGMGAHFQLNIHERSELSVLAAQYAGISVATVPGAAVSIYKTDLSGPVAWIFGNEGAGLSPELAQCARITAAIPMPGRANSLNVASAVAVCLFEQLRQRIANS